MSETAMQPPFLLIAMPWLTDIHFAKSVVLVTSLNEEGALGFIINKPSDVRIKDLLVDSEPQEECFAERAWYGGPIGLNSGVIIHNQQIHVHADWQICEGLSISTELTAIQEYDDFAKRKIDVSLQTDDVNYPIRFMAGYAGWGPGQLEQEIFEGAWQQIPYCSKLVFSTPWKRMWDMAQAVSGITPTKILPVTKMFLN